MVGGIVQQVINTITVSVRDKQATATAINVGEVLTRRTHCRGIDDWHHLGNMVLHQAVE
ncbi:Uncharacterised protein [Vibrio cholerae]|nr:Uncharacterised protein [Vibrio cholerae]